MDRPLGSVSHFFTRSIALRLTFGQSMSAGFEILTKATAPSALYDYHGHEFDVPRCHKNTRVAILDKIGEWVLVFKLAIIIMWLYGAAGAGKSAIARTMSEILDARRQLLATFFFSRADSSRNNIKSVIPTLAYKICLSVPESRPLITTAIENDPHIFHHPFPYQFKHLIVEPLQQLSRQGVTYPTVIVIDGLDECLNHEERTTLLHAISANTGNFFAPLKFLITSRPEVPIARVFDAAPVIDVSIRHSLDDEPKSIEDVGYFLSAKFDEIKRTHPTRRHIHHDWPSLRIKADLVQKSSGQFIYPATIIRYISSPRHSPTLRLDIVLRLRPLSGQSPFAQLDALYRHILLSCDNVQLALRIIGMCLLSAVEMFMPWDDVYCFPSKMLTTPEYMERILGLHPGDIQRGLEDLGSLIEYKGDNTELRVLHASLFDFLSDPSRFMDLPFNIASIHTNLAIWCSHLDSCRDNFQIPDLHSESDILLQFLLLGKERLKHMLIYVKQIL